MSQECVKQGICRKCGSPNVITSEPHNHSGIWCTRTATCVSCHTSEEYVYELVFVGYEKPGSDDILPAPSDRPTEAIEKLSRFRLKPQLENCEDAPFFSERVLRELINKKSTDELLALWKAVVGEDLSVLDPVLTKKDAMERFSEFQLEVTPEGCEEDAPFLSESVLYPLVGKTDARTILALWKNIEQPEEE